MPRARVHRSCKRITIAVWRHSLEATAWCGIAAVRRLARRTALPVPFRVEDPAGKPAGDMEFYMGMLGHAAFVRSDRSVFAHVHPNGPAPWPRWGSPARRCARRRTWDGRGAARRSVVSLWISRAWQLPDLCPGEAGRRVLTGVFDARVENRSFADHSRQERSDHRGRPWHREAAGAGIRRSGRARGLAVAQPGRTGPGEARDRTGRRQRASARADVRDWNRLQAAVDRMKVVFGGLDVLIASAGVRVPIGPLLSATEGLDRDLEINLIGAANACRVALPPNDREAVGQDHPDSGRRVGPHASEFSATPRRRRRWCASPKGWRWK